MNRLALLLVVLLLAPLDAQAQNRLIAPLAGIGQIVVLEPLINDVKTAADCKIDIKEVQKYIADYLARESLPVIAVENTSDMVRTDVFRLNIRPEIATLKDGVVSCVSWVAVKAESQHTVRLPPLPDRKTVTVSYWNRGGLVMTPIVDHAVGIQNAYTILLRGFVKQYRIDNPGLNTPDAVENADTLKSKLPPTGQGSELSPGASGGTVVPGQPTLAPTKTIPQMPERTTTPPQLAPKPGLDDAGPKPQEFAPAR